MADIGEDFERHCHELLLKLKKTTESLLANQSAQGPWGTYGALRRICDDAEAILCHRVRKKHPGPASVGSFWHFVQGLRWLSPRLAPAIEKINSLKQSQNMNGVEDGKLWLRDSVEEHSLMAQLDVLSSDMEYLHSHYHDDAFLCQPSYREAMRICFKAIELNKPALLAEISPRLLRSGQVEPFCPQSKSLPGTGSLLRRSQSDWNARESAMGNRNSHLNVHYSSHLSSSNMSLSVDPSLGGSSLLQQKIYSGPCFVSSLDSPGLLESLGSHPITDAMGSAQHSSMIHQFPQQVEPQFYSRALRQSVHTGRNKTSPGVHRPSSLSPSDDCIPHAHDSSLSSDISGKTLLTLEVPNPMLGKSDSSSSFEDVSHEAECLLRGKSDSLRLEDDFIPEQRSSQLSLSILDSSYPESEKSYKHSGHIDIQALSLSNGSSMTPGSFMGPGNSPQMSESYSSQQGFMRNGSHVSLGMDALVSDNLDGSPICDNLLSGLIKDVNSDVVDTCNHSGRYKINKLSDSEKRCLSNSDLRPWVKDSFSPIDKKQFFLAKSDPSLIVSPSTNNVLAHGSWGRGNPASPQPWSESDLYSMMSPAMSPVLKNSDAPWKSSGCVYIPIDETDGASGDSAARSAAAFGSNANNSSADNTRARQTMSDPLLGRKLGHKRWVSDTTAIRIEGAGTSDAPASTTPQPSSVSATIEVKPGRPVHRPNGCRASGWETESYQSTLTKPTEGQSLMSYLTSQDFNTCANLEKENAHFHISEALIAAFESMKWNRMMQKQAGGRRSSSSASSSSDEEIHALRQRIRIRKREKFLEKAQPFPSVSDGLPDTVTTSRSASSPANSSRDVSSMSEDSQDDEEDGRDIDVSMSSDGHSNLAELRSSGLTLSMASLYSDAELARSNKQMVRINTLEESLHSPGSAEFIAISLLKRFSEKHLPKASELQWLVTEVDVPQPLLPLPQSIPISPDDIDNDAATPNKTRLRGNMEWAPPRQQIIFSVHSPEKRETVLSRQNYRCAGCGLKVDRAFIKRYRYCEYLGKYFCQCCHTSEISVIPGHVLERWHFGRFPVSTFSYSLLERIWAEPLFHLDTINPTLYKRVRVLETIREGRQQLVHLQSLLAVCKRDPKLLKEMQALPSHWLANDDSYSMADFMEVKSGTMLQRIRTFVNVALNHIRDCQLCQGLGFLCGMCQDSRVIFPFQLDTVVTCQVCQSCYHKDCFVPDKCPKCIRREARRSAQLEPLSPDSPDSGNEDSTCSDKTLVSGGSPMSGSADELR